MDNILLKKFESFIQTSSNEKEAMQFLSELSRDEYDELISLLEQNSFENMKPEGIQDLLLVLKTLRSKFI